ncbi:hypothetical protein LSS_17440 [Leptospira santarosai serovar Shermani str. LT 821]|uniref:Uncharacterized protein n=1 Tax=Leptospira santarosai serovar Shermani str. LT 821 TaxID=758847 RepID=K8XX72_9LEPT|nr:hypothetical protein LSS_17440 [Leptospira santarosai serovar Shermani str. LT 821]
MPLAKETGRKYIPVVRYGNREWGGIGGKVTVERNRFL